MCHGSLLLESQPWTYTIYLQEASWISWSQDTQNKTLSGKWNLTLDRSMRREAFRVVGSNASDSPTPAHSGHIANIGCGTTFRRRGRRKSSGENRKLTEEAVTASAVHWRRIPRFQPPVIHRQFASTSRTRKSALEERNDLLKHSYRSEGQ